MMTEQDLLNLKKDINTAKTNKANLEGQKEGIMKQLRDTFKVKTVEEANTKLSQLERQQKVLEQKIKDGIEELEEKYNLQNNDSKRD